MLGGNAARLYGFDLDALAQVAARVGPDPRRDRPSPSPLGEIPADADPLPGLRRAER